MSLLDQLTSHASDPRPRPEHQRTRAGLTPLDGAAARQPARPGEVGGEAIGSPLLQIARGPQAGAVFAVPPGTTTVGRGRDCDIVLDDPTVSRQHAELHRTGGQVMLHDAGSLNGTYLNQHPCDEAALNDGDQIWIGKFRLVFRDR